MDYSKVYQKFISQRRLKESLLSLQNEYTETHHIVPRCLGGDDSPENLIALTPEDHYFAHLLLAKIHGGNLWFAVKSMGNLTANTERSEIFKRRIKYGHIRKSIAKHFAENLSGENAYRTDHSIYTLHNFDGRIAYGKRFEIENATGLCKRAVCSLVNGNKKSYNGWYTKEHNPEALTPSEQKKKINLSAEVFTLYHIDGRIFTGTRSEFKEKFGRRLYFQSENGGCAGWYKQKCFANEYQKRMKAVRIKNSSKRGCIFGSSNPNADRNFYDFENEITGQKVRMTRTELVNTYGLKTSQVTGVIKGTQIAAGEWKLQGAKRLRAKAK